MTRYKGHASVEERFWRNVEKSDGCWRWISRSTNTQGYGVLLMGGRGSQAKAAHRYSWELHFGPIPEGQKVLHKCDTPLCVRPDHLFLGTQLDNMRDMIAKGRRGRTGPPKGQRLTVTDAQILRVHLLSGTMSQQKIAGVVGISQSHVSRILRGSD